MAHLALRALADERLDPLSRKILKAQARIARRMYEVMGAEEAIRQLERAIAAVETMREETLNPQVKNDRRAQEDCRTGAQEAGAEAECGEGGIAGACHSVEEEVGP